MARRNLLVLSAVLPFPGSAGQQQRVRNKLLALSERFHVTFLTFAPEAEVAGLRARLAELVDLAIVLPSRYQANPLARLWHRLRAELFARRRSLKTSNYAVRLEFDPRRVETALEGLFDASDCDGGFDLALFEYWHAHTCAPMLRRHGIPSVLDMHDLLWRTYERQRRDARLLGRPLPAAWNRYRVDAYRRQEEAAWLDFDALITINRDEHAYVGEKLPEMQRFYAPMGVNLAEWPFQPAPILSANPAGAPRIAYYGGLATKHNQQAALRCYREILPRLRRHVPDLELWLVGSHPPARLQALAQEDTGVKVTGFVPEVQPVLASMHAVVCPWVGTYGFRSRLIEVMALGVPVVATPDAVAGMELIDGEGLFLADDDDGMAEALWRLLGDPEHQAAAGRAARAQVEGRYGFDATYRRLAWELDTWLDTRAPTPNPVSGTRELDGGTVPRTTTEATS